MCEERNMGRRKCCRSLILVSTVLFVMVVSNSYWIHRNWTAQDQSHSRNYDSETRAKHPDLALSDQRIHSGESPPKRVNASKIPEDLPGWNFGKSQRVPTPRLNSTKETNYSVPNLVHVIRIVGSLQNLGFTEMLSIQSVFKYQNPDQVYLHFDYEPSGEWWVELISKFSQQIVIKIVEPELYPKLPGSSKMSALKLEILVKYGGIIIETDVILIRSLNPLRVHNFTAGAEESLRLSSGVMLANMQSTFLRELLKQLTSHSPALAQPDGIKVNFLEKAYHLAKKHPEDAHIEEESLSFPDLVHHSLLFSKNEHLRWWKKHYVVHFNFQKGEAAMYNPDNIKKMHTLIGSVLRLIYYDSSDLMDPLLPHLLYANKTST